MDAKTKDVFKNIDEKMEISQSEKDELMQFETVKTKENNEVD